MKKIDRTEKRLIAFTLVFFVVVALITLALLPHISRLSEAETQKDFQGWVSSLGVWGWLTVLGIQVLQVIIAFIPGEPVEIIAGVLYGGLGGLAICLVGCVLASAVIFILTKRFGKPLVDKLIGEGKLSEYDFLKDSQKLETIVFVLFLIPGTPKDLLTYIFGTTSMKLPQFLLISTFARIPSIASSTYLGLTMRSGKWAFSLIIFTVTAIVGIIGIRYKDRIINSCRKQGNKSGKTQ